MNISVMHFFPSSLNFPSLSSRHFSQYHTLVVVQKVTNVPARSSSVFLKIHVPSLSHGYLTSKAYDTGFFNIKNWLSLNIRKSIKTHGIILHK